MEYLRLSIKYFKKNIKIFYLLIFSIAVGISLVFSVQVAKRSQAINNINYINKVSPTYNAQTFDLDKKTTELLKKHKNVESIQTYKSLGVFIDKKTESGFILNEYNDKAIKSKKYELVKGRVPKNANEVIIKSSEDKYQFKIGDSIDGYIRNEYILNGSNCLFMKKKNFKIVGIVKRKYHTNTNDNSTEIYTALNNKDNLIPKEAIVYDSTINLKTGFNDLYSNVHKLGIDVGIQQNNLFPNQVRERLMGEKDSENVENPDLERVIISNILFVTSVFCLFMKKRLKDIGLIRIVGGSKRGFSLSIIFENLFIAFLGCGLGLIVGYLIAMYLNRYIDLGSTLTIPPTEDIPLHLKSKDIILAIKVALFSVSISIIIQLIALNFSNKLDLVNNKNCFDNIFENIRLSRKNLWFIKKLTTKLAFKNCTRNLIPMLVPIIIIMMATGRWIDCLSANKMDKTDIPSRTISQFQSRYNQIVKNSAYSCLYGMNENDFKKLKNIHGVSDILKLKKVDGYGIISQDILSNEFKFNNDDQCDSQEISFTISGYEEEYFKSKDIFSSGGYKNLNNDELSILITENFYDRYEHKNSKIFKNIKVGDTIRIKLPVLENELQKYKTFDVKIAGILNEKWSIYKDSPSESGEIIFNINKLKQITNSNTYDVLKFNTSGNLRDIKEKFNEQYYSITNIKEAQKENVELKKQFHNSLIVITIFLMIIAFANIYATLKGSIMLRIREISIIRAIGADQNTVYKMLMKESLIYGFICAMAGSVYGIFKAYKYYTKVVYASNQVSGFSTIKFELPILQIIMLFILVLIFCFIIVNTSLKPILKENLVDGIKDGE